MYSAPDDLPEAVLASVLAEHWGLSGARLTYRPVGFGSHHWAAAERWFVTVDDLETKRHTADEPLTAAYGRLRAALTAAASLAASYVVAPRPSHGGDLVVRCGDRYAVAVYPYIEGQSFTWGEFSSPEHRRAVLDILVEVHGSTVHSGVVEDFTIAHEDALDLRVSFVDSGPYSLATARLLAEHADAVRRLRERYRDLVATASTAPMVLTHGEPHPGNTMLGPDGWLLIDWDTAMMAPPERDLWALDPGDGSILAAYAAATGVTPQAELLELYGLRWDLLDLAVAVSRFRRPHTGTTDDYETFVLLRSLLSRL